MRSRGSDGPDDVPDERRDGGRGRGRGRRWGRGRPEPAPEEQVSGAELGWLADLRTAKEQRADIGPGGAEAAGGARGAAEAAPPSRRGIVPPELVGQPEPDEPRIAATPVWPSSPAAPPEPAARRTDRREPDARTATVGGQSRPPATAGAPGPDPVDRAPRARSQSAGAVAEPDAGAHRPGAVPSVSPATSSWLTGGRRERDPAGAAAPAPRDSGRPAEPDQAPPAARGAARPAARERARPPARDGAGTPAQDQSRSAGAPPASRSRHAAPDGGRRPDATGTGDVTAFRPPEPPPGRSRHAAAPPTAPPPATPRPIGAPPTGPAAGGSRPAAPPPAGSRSAGPPSGGSRSAGPPSGGSGPPVAERPGATAASASPSRTTPPQPAQPGGRPASRFVPLRATTGANPVLPRSGNALPVPPGQAPAAPPRRAGGTPAGPTSGPPAAPTAAPPSGPAPSDERPGRSPAGWSGGATSRPVSPAGGRPPAGPPGQPGAGAPAGTRSDLPAARPPRHADAADQDPTTARGYPARPVDGRTGSVPRRPTATAADEQPHWSTHSGPHAGAGRAGSPAPPVVPGRHGARPPTPPVVGAAPPGRAGPAPIGRAAAGSTGSAGVGGSTGSAGVRGSARPAVGDSGPPTVVTPAQPAPAPRASAAARVRVGDLPPTDLPSTGSPPADRPPTGLPSAGPSIARAAVAASVATAPGGPLAVDPARAGVEARTRSGPAGRRAGRLRQWREPRRLILAVAALVVLGALPAYFGIRTASRDPVFTSLDGLAVPAWAAAGPVDVSSGSRWCFVDCLFRERTTHSQRPPQETAQAYQQALTAAGWRPWAVALCPEQPVDGSYTCWQRDELTLDLWVRTPSCPAASPTTEVAPDPPPATAEGAAPACPGATVSVKVRNAINDDRGRPEPTRDPRLTGEDPDPVITNDPLQGPTPSPS